jgi:hypothetical protein
MTDMRRSHPVVHLELHTSDLAQARSLDSGLLGRRSERVDTDCGSYLALELGGRLGGGSSSATPRTPSGSPTWRSDLSA